MLLALVLLLRDDELGEPLEQGVRVDPGEDSRGRNRAKVEVNTLCTLN